MKDHPAPLGGTCSARFEPLRELFAAKLDSGEDLGASLAVNVDGEMEVDLWGGWADEDRTAPWGENTITNVFSTTKTMTALAALIAGHEVGGVHAPTLRVRLIAYGWAALVAFFAIARSNCCWCRCRS